MKILHFGQTNFDQPNAFGRGLGRCSSTFAVEDGKRSRSPGLLPVVCAMAIVLCGVASVRAQVWSPTDDVINGSASDIISDSAGNIYVSGQIRELQPDGTTSYHAAVLKSSDRGVTWDNDPSTVGVEEPSYYSPSGTGPASFSAIAVTTVQTQPGSFQDQLVAAGSFQGAWVVYRSVDAGASWSPISDPFLSGYDSQSIRKLAFDSAGNIYIIGNAQRRITTKKATTTVNHWLIRKGTNGSDGTYSWRTVADFSFSGSASLFGVVCVGTDVFVAGSADSFWEVRKSSNGGATWEVADRFQLEAGYGASAFGITADSLGNLFVVGGASRNGPRRANENLWVVRKGTKGAAAYSFKTVDSYLGNGNMQPRGAAVAPDGTVHVVGCAVVSPGLLPKWLTRQGTPGANGSWTWSDTNVFYLATDKPSQGFGITADRSGNLFAHGAATFPDGIQHSWLVRRKLASEP